MKIDDPVKGLEKLVCQGGFGSRRSLEEFCLAIGIFHDRRSKKEYRVPRSWDPSRYGIWPLLQVITHDMRPDIDDMEGMRELLYPYLIGGSEMVHETIGDVKGTGALKALSGLLPP